MGIDVLMLLSGTGWVGPGLDTVCGNSAALKDTDERQTLFEIEEKWCLCKQLCLVNVLYTTRDGVTNW